MTASLCDFNDLNCDTPLMSAATDMLGEVSLPFPTVPGVQQSNLSLGLNGFIKITGADYVPCYYYWGFPISEPQFFSYAEIVSEAENRALAMDVGVTLNPDRGQLAVSAYDCDGNPAPDVEIGLDSTDTGITSFTTSGAATSVTDAMGVITFDNVPAGAVQVTTTPQAIKRPSARIGVTVRAATLTEALVYPTPAP